MKAIEITAHELAGRFIGIHEIRGEKDHPLIQWFHSLCDEGTLDVDDEVAWCYSFAQAPAYLLGLPRSRSRRARSWLKVGIPVPMTDAEVGFDVVVLRRGPGLQPGPDVIAAPGHVGYFGGWEVGPPRVRVRGGNQGDAVTDALFPAAQVLEIRRLLV